ncbi:MAG: hypothetical protein ABSC11_00735 [Smithella sp.]|jgi:hypothetical protein
MKRILMLAVIAVFLGMPIASFAKTAISDSDLDALTAQKGISINFTNFAISSGVTAGKMVFGDADGLGSLSPLVGFNNADTYPSAGFMAMNGIVITGNLVEITGTMNVDVGTSGGQTELNVALPTVTIGGASGMSITANVILDSAKALNGGSGSLVALSIQGFSTSVTGTVTVFAH